EAGGDDELALATALDALAKQLAIEIVADGEGTTRVARLEVRGATGTAEPMARAVANSPLVKCALFGGDPNWGRMLQAAGEALPDIREFAGKTVVIKYGGAAMGDDVLREAFAADVVLLKYVGLNPIVVHGGRREITQYMDRLGLEVKFVEGLRVSSRETVEV